MNHQIILEKKSAKRLNNLIGQYEGLKYNYLIVNGDKIEFTIGFKIEIEKLSEKWVQFCKMSYDYKAKRNADLSAFKRYVERDVKHLNWLHWYNLVMEEKERCKDNGFYNMDKLIELHEKEVKPGDVLEQVKG